MTQVPVSALRVLIVEDHLMVAEGLELGLGARDDMEVIGLCSTLADARVAIPRLDPDVVLVDYRLPDGEGIDLVVEYGRRERPATIVVTSYVDAALARVALAEGCRGFVLKHTGLEEVVRALHAVQRGEVHVSAALLSDLLPGRRPAGAPVLTTRELQVLELLATGAGTADMATHLYLSVNTVRNHVQNVLTKLGAQSRLEAVAIATRLGLVSRV